MSLQTATNFPWHTSTNSQRFRNLSVAFFCLWKYKFSFYQSFGWELYDDEQEMKRQGLDDAMEDSSISLSKWVCPLKSIQLRLGYVFFAM
jgi:hypothetical protein